MASPRAIAAVLAYLHELYPTREIGVATTEAWAMTFAAWDDETLTACARAAAATPGRTFFPTPGELAALRPENAPPVVDGQKILRQISQLGTYSAHVGMIAPHVGAVRDALGDVIADAYASAGSERLFSDDDKTRSIAERDFQKAAEQYAAMPDTPRPLLESGDGPRLRGRRTDKPESIAAIVARSLPPGTAA